jgi:hypothetical protein
VSRRAATVLSGAILLVLTGPLAAVADESCAPLGVSCQLGVVIDPAADPGPLDEIAGPVDDIVGEVEDRIDPVVDGVQELIDDVLGGGGIIDPPVIDPPVIDPPGGGDRGSDHDAGPGTGGPDDARARSTSPGDPAIVVTTAAREGGSATDISARNGARGTPVGSALPPGGIVQAAITGTLLLLGLFVVSVGFVLFQDHLDRSDPKLAIAPVRAETVAFE